MGFAKDAWENLLADVGELEVDFVEDLLHDRQDELSKGVLDRLSLTSCKRRRRVVVPEYLGIC